MTLPRTLEREAMDTQEEARDYDAMDHGAVNSAFVGDFLALAESSPFSDRLREPQNPFDILDVGTGTALIPIELCRRPVFCRVVAVDLAEEMLKVAAKNVFIAGLRDRVDVQRVDSKQLPYADESFCSVMSNSIVHHIAEPKQVLAEMLRVMRSGGVLFVRDLIRPDDEQQLDALVESYASDANEHQRQMFADSLRAALTLNEIRAVLDDFSMPTDWANQTSDRHWTIAAIR